MDRYEYKLKVEQLEHLMQEQDFETAAEIADTINWRKVKSAATLCMVGEIYDRSKRYEDSREILLMAYDKAAVGRNILYRLTLVALKMRNVEEAKDYYEEFLDVAPHDNSKYVLRYQIAKQEGAPLSAQIEILEEFKEREFREEWVFELAYLYHRIGDGDRCVATCDELVLWFGDGKYVEKALEMKLLHQPLDQEQEKKYRQFKRQKRARGRVRKKETAEPEDTVREEMPEIKPSPNRFNTSNLQAELAKSMQKIMNANDKEAVSDTMDNIKKMVKDIPYLQVPRTKEALAEEERQFGHIETEEEIDQSLNSQFNELLAEDWDGQFRMHVPNGVAYEPQVAGQMDFQDVLSEWKKTQHVIEAVMENAKQRKLESAKARAWLEAQELLERLNHIMPELEAGISAQELLKERYMQNGQHAEEPYHQEGYAERSCGQESSIEPFDGQEGYAGEPYSQEGYGQDEYIGQPYGQDSAAEQPDSQDGYAGEGYGQEGYTGQPGSQDGYAGEGYGQEGYTGQSDSQEGYTEEDYGQEDYTEQPDDQEGYTEAGYGQEDYTGQPDDQEGYTEAGYGQEDYTEQPDSQKGYTEAGYGQEDYTGQPDNQEGYTEAGYGQEDYTGQPDNQEGYTEEGYGQKEYTESPYVHNSYTQEGHAQGAYEKEDYGKDRELEETDSCPISQETIEIGSQDEIPQESCLQEEVPEEGILQSSSPEKGAAQGGLLEENSTQGIQSAVSMAQNSPLEEPGFSSHIVRQIRETPRSLGDGHYGTPNPNLSFGSRERRRSSSVIPLEKLIEKQAQQEPVRERNKDAEEFLESAFRAAKASREEKHSVPKIQTEPGDGHTARLSDEQKEIFSYFVPVVGMEQQLCRVLEGVGNRQEDNRSSSGNIIITGGKGSGKTVLATDFIKAIQKGGKHPNGKVGKIAGASLNQKDLSQLLKKVAGGYLIIERAGEMNHETVTRLALLLDQDTNGLLVIAEDTRKEMEKVLSLDVNFAKKFTEWIKIPVFTSDELVEFAKAYAKEQECEIDDMGILALYNRISNIQKLDEATTLTEVKEIVDEAISSAERGGLKKIFGRKKFSPEGYLYLRERDFDD